jgi:hypothetical protein
MSKEISGKYYSQIVCAGALLYDLLQPPMIVRQIRITVWKGLSLPKLPDATLQEDRLSLVHRKNRPPKTATFNIHLPAQVY